MPHFFYYHTGFPHRTTILYHTNKEAEDANMIRQDYNPSNICIVWIDALPLVNLFEPTAEANWSLWDDGMVRNYEVLRAPLHNLPPQVVTFILRIATAHNSNLKNATWLTQIAEATCYDYWDGWIELWYLRFKNGKPLQLWAHTYVHEGRYRFHFNTFETLQAALHALHIDQDLNSALHY